MAREKTVGRYRLRSHTLSFVCDIAPGPMLRVDEARMAAVVACRAFSNARADWTVENFAVLGLDARGYACAFKIISTGTLTSTLVHPREVFRFAILEGCAHIVVVHNHPSGLVDASPEDLTLTARLREAGLIVGIPLVDHVIITQRGDYASIGALGSG